MKFLIAYGTTEGQTRKIARFVADRLAGAGHAVELLAAADAGDLVLSGFAGAILAASVHAGSYQKAFVGFARDRAAELATLPTLFLSVSLAAAGDDPEEHRELDAIVGRMTDATGWRPGRVEHVAGAFRFGDYDFFKAWMMRRIAREKGEDAPAEGRDTEYTDWAALGALVDAWVAGLRKTA